ncbi:hypothetical protein [Methylopila turkensis]|uniref:Uncharacterized protein n=1 Tax=Methylopila turkensis TaxID=1437816 RepID=A0A9W6JTX1_9HYPH|nr:hypothetical protein [Methylopila turkensis]GLK81503.1 hypothetical protein GCM10008174_32440 [Methylopila turkensis]
MSTFKVPLSEQDAELIAQALDVYATTLMCAPLGLGLELLMDVRELRSRIAAASDEHEAAQDAPTAAGGNVVAFARA